MQQDEEMRRNFYTRYFNLIDAFDRTSPILERQMGRCMHYWVNLDSSYLFWYFKANTVAEIRAYRKLESQIVQKQAEQGDELSRAILEIEKELKWT